jgi:hypothetical protein
MATSNSLKIGFLKNCIIFREMMRNLTPLFLLLLARLSLSGEGTEGLFHGQEKVQKAYFMVRRRYRRLILWSGEGTEGLFSHFKTGFE